MSDSGYLIDDRRGDLLSRERLEGYRAALLDSEQTAEMPPEFVSASLGYVERTLALLDDR